MLLKTTKFVAICYHLHRKRIQSEIQTVQDSNQLEEVMGTGLVYSGGSDNRHRHHLLAVLEVASPRSRHCQGWVPLRLLALTDSWPASHVALPFTWLFLCARTLMGSLPVS